MSAAEAEHRLVCNLLRSALPNDLQTLVLRLCLVGDGEALAAWRRWLETEPDVRQSLGSQSAHLKRLLALIYYRIQREGETVEASLQTYLRTARAHEQLRTEKVRRICRCALESLRTVQVEPIVLKGMAIAETAYPEASLRHCHDMDLLLQEEEVPVAMNALREAGFKAGAAPPGAVPFSFWMQHESGFPIGLHTSLYRIPPWNEGLHEARDSAVSAEVVVGCLAGVLSPVEALVHICCHGITMGNPYSPTWTSDAWFLLAKAGPGLNWEDVTVIAGRGHRAIPLLVALEYLATELQAPIPAAAIQTLRESSRDREAIELARAAAMMSARGRPLALLRAAGGTGDRARTAWWLLFPSRLQLHWAEGASMAGPLPAHYLRRLVRFVLGLANRGAKPTKRAARA